MSKDLVSAIIVTKGSGDYLRSALDSLRQQQGCRLEIILVDNSPDPRPARDLAGEDPALRLAVSGRDAGYAGALNTGIAMSAGEFVLCLNDDVVLQRRFVDEALRGFSVDRRVGMVSGMCLRWDEQTVDTTGLSVSPFCSAKDRGYGSKDKRRFQKEGFIFGVNGAAAVYRRAMLEDVKIGDEYFDGDYHIFYEDLDIAWRAHKRGWKAYFVPQAVAYHARGGTVRKGRGIGRPRARSYLDDDRYFDLVRNRYLTIIKNAAVWDLAWRLPFLLVYEALTWAHIACTRRSMFAKFAAAGPSVRSALQKRRLIAQKT